jgi:iodotyrosine deiodinase
MRPAGDFPSVAYVRERVPPELMIETARVFRDTLRLRRTVREFSSEAVPAEVIDLALEAAASAPSGAKLQPWKFVGVRDPSLKHQIRLAAEKVTSMNPSASRAASCWPL